jgi:S1-C subfamily serine protease
VIRPLRDALQNSGMNASTLATFSSELADTVERTGASVVQVQGGSRPATGIAYAASAVLTTIRALGREDGLAIRTPDGSQAAAELAGWDPATGLAMLRVQNAVLAPAPAAARLVRVGELAIALGRSWSNALTASLGIVAVVGGPLRTGRRGSIEQVIRTTAPMHSGFAGGALITASGELAGVATASQIRGLGVVIPAAIAWPLAASILQHGRPKRGYLGVAGQPVHLDRRQREISGRERGMLIVGLSGGSPAEQAGLMVGDCLVDFDGRPISSPDDLLELLTGDRVGQSIAARVLRAGAVVDLTITVGERRPGESPRA